MFTEADLLQLRSGPPSAEREVVFCKFLNLFETQETRLRELTAKLASMEAELRRLKGLTPPPNPGKPPGTLSSPTNISSEKERQQPRPWQKQGKRGGLQITRTEICVLRKESLPPDAVFKGYTEVVVQDLLLQVDNVCFRKEVYYSAQAGKSFTAPLPPGYEGQFGPGGKALTLSLSYGGRMSEAVIHQFLTQLGMKISRGMVAFWISQPSAQFHTEAAEVLLAGLASTPWQHLDLTSTKVNGIRQQCHILSSPLHTSFRTTPSGDRPSVLETLRGGEANEFLLDENTLDLMQEMGASAQFRGLVRQECGPQLRTEAEFTALLAEKWPQLGPQQYRRLWDAASIVAYRFAFRGPRVHTLVCDDASVFRWITLGLQLCWIHEGRHYKKLQPHLLPHQRILAKFQTQFWEFYRSLRDYRLAPTPAERARLNTEFDTLFTANTGYCALDECLARTAAKKPDLLLVLKHPELPIHNNPAELAARQRVQKRVVSFGPRSAAGCRAWDTMQSLAVTAGQLGVHFWEYLRDRLSQAQKIPRLAELIRIKAAELPLGASWEPA